MSECEVCWDSESLNPLHIPLHFMPKLPWMLGTCRREETYLYLLIVSRTEELMLSLLNYMYIECYEHAKSGRPGVKTLCLFACKCKYSEAGWFVQSWNRIGCSLEMLIPETAELVDTYPEIHSDSYSLLTLASIQRNRFENIFIEDSKLVEQWKVW